MSKNKTQLHFMNRVIWITGASSGIGEELAIQLGPLGARLILSARNARRLMEVKEKINAPADHVRILPMDLENLDCLPGKVKEALSMFGQIDVLVNNAAVAVRDYALATDHSVDRKLMNINYFGPVVLTKNLLPSMLERGRGQLVVISSMSAKYGVPRLAAYSASKHALHGFFESLRSEIAGKGVSITMVVPGLIKTDITAHAIKGDGTPFGRVEKTYLTAFPADKAVNKMLRAVIGEREEVNVGGYEVMTLWLQRLSPWLIRRIIRNHPIKKIRNLKNRLSVFKRESVAVSIEKR